MFKSPSFFAVMYDHERLSEDVLTCDLECHAQEFINPDISNISCPVFGTAGTQDNVLGGNEAAFFAKLSPETQGQEPAGHLQCFHWRRPTWPGMNSSGCV